jgi:hypothetical protein
MQLQRRLCGSSVAGTVGTDRDRHQQDAMAMGSVVRTGQGADPAKNFDRNPKVDLLGIGSQFG